MHYMGHLIASLQPCHMGLLPAQPFSAISARALASQSPAMKMPGRLTDVGGML